MLANIAPLKAANSSNSWHSCTDIARLGDGDDCDGGEECGSNEKCDGIVECDRREECGGCEKCDGGEGYGGGKDNVWWWRVAAVRVMVGCSGRHFHGAVVGIWWVFPSLGILKLG